MKEQTRKLVEYTVPIPKATVDDLKLIAENFGPGYTKDQALHSALDLRNLLIAHRSPLYVVSARQPERLAIDPIPEETDLNLIYRLDPKSNRFRNLPKDHSQVVPTAVRELATVVDKSNKGAEILMKTTFAEKLQQIRTGQKPTEYNILRIKPRTRFF